MLGLSFGMGIKLSNGGMAQSSTTYLAASTNALLETASEGTVAATLSIIGDEYVAPASFTLTSDPSGFFEIVGNELWVSSGASFDYEAGSSYTVIIEGTDAAPNTYSKTVFVAISNVNEAPTDISLSATSVSEEGAIGDVIATISSSGDPDVSDTATYTITSDPDNKFLITGTDLKLNGALDYATDTSHNVTIRVSDGGGLFHDELFVIDVTEVAGSTLWKTTDLPSQVAGFDGSRQTAGDVAAWTDYFGNGNDATQANAADQPRCGDDTLNGLNVLTFDGASDFLNVNSNIYSLANGSNHVIGLARMDTNVRYLFGCDVSGGTRFYIRYLHSARLLNYRCGNSFSDTVGDASELGNWVLFSAYRSGTTQSMATDGNLTPATNSDGSSVNPDSGSIGATSVGGGANFLDGNIAQIMFFDAALGVSDVQKAEGRLAHKFSVQSLLPVAHPYKTNPPMV